MRRRDILAFIAAFSLVARATASNTGARLKQGNECAPVRGAPLEPFSASFSMKGATLVVLATHHANDQRSPTFELVRRAFSGGGPDLVLVEGMASELGPSPLGFAMPLSNFKGDESRYAASMAAESRRPFFGIEPSDLSSNSALLKYFEVEDILGALVLRAVGSYLLREQRSDGLERFVQGVANTYTRADPRFSGRLRNFSSWYYNAYGVSPWVDPNLGKRGTPCSSGMAGRIIKELTWFRNEHIAQLVNTVFPATPKVLLVFGSGHYRALASIFQARFGQPSYDSASTISEIH